MKKIHLDYFEKLVLRMNENLVYLKFKKWNLENFMK